MSKHKNFTYDNGVEQVQSIIREVLDNNQMSIEFVSVQLKENFETNVAKFSAKVVEVYDDKPRKRTIAGEGVGLVDACFDGMIKGYEERFDSLDSISIVDFSVNAHVERGSKRRSDANVTALLRIKNADEHVYSFSCTTPSISKSSVFLVKESIAFFINAEISYIKLYRALKDAEERGRSDLVERFKNQMGTLVHATSYEKLVQKIKRN